MILHRLRSAVPALRRVPLSRLASGFAVVLLGVVALWLLARHVAFYFPRTVDDMFISLRYAERLVEGQGLTYNDDAAVEGFSNPLWVFGQALFMALGLEGVTATKLLSVLSLGALFGGMAVFARRLLGLPHVLAVAALVLAATNSYVISWAMWGLETPAYLALLLWYPIALSAVLEAPSRRRQVAAVAVTLALMLTRPEAGLYVLSVGAALWLGRWWPRRDGLAELRRRFVALLPVALGSGAVVGTLLLARKAYYGLWLPHTYYAKRGDGFALEKLAPLVEQGAGWWETRLLLGALALSVVLALVRRQLVPLAIAASCLLLVARVEVDWMPNQRHLLPVHVVAMLVWWWPLAELWRARSRLLPRAPALGLALTLGAAVLLAWPAWRTAEHWWSIDARYSPEDFATHGRGEHWIREKTEATWQDAWDALAGREPEHAAHLGVEHGGGGMITQLFMVLEASALPEEETWFIGRDIGRVGYYSPVQIFDTAALFTPGALLPGHDPAQPVPREIVAAAFEGREVVAAELIGGWNNLSPQLRRAYSGSWRVRPRETPRPGPRQILERYDRVVAKLPAGFTLATLYGESVGAAIVRRRDWVHEQLAGLEAFVVDAVPEDARHLRAVTFDGALELHGCSLSAEEGAPGERLEVRCYYETLRPVARDYGVFIHLENAQGHVVAKADHRPVGGFLPIPQWRAGELVLERFIITLPEAPAEQSLVMHLGLWDERGRARVQPDTAHDGKDRAIGPTLRVRPAP